MMAAPRNQWRMDTPFLTMSYCHKYVIEAKKKNVTSDRERQILCVLLFVESGKAKLMEIESRMWSSGAAGGGNEEVLVNGYKLPSVR